MLPPHSHSLSHSLSLLFRFPPLPPPLLVNTIKLDFGDVELKEQKKIEKRTNVKAKEKSVTVKERTGGGKEKKKVLADKVIARARTTSPPPKAPTPPPVQKRAFVPTKTERRVVEEKALKAPTPQPEEPAPAAAKKKKSVYVPSFSCLINEVECNMLSAKEIAAMCVDNVNRWGLQVNREKKDCERKREKAREKKVGERDVKRKIHFRMCTFPTSPTSIPKYLYLYLSIPLSLITYRRT